MLQKLNERIQGLVAWIIIVLVTITFALFGLDYYMQSHHDAGVQVDVNGQPITKQTFELSYRRARQSRHSSNMTVLSEQQLKQQILNELIVNNVSVQSARSNGFEVSTAQADAAILNIPQFQEEGHFSKDRYTQVLTNAFFTPESFQKEVRQGMLLNQQRFALMGTSFALPEDIEQFVKLYMQTRDYHYLQIPAAHFLNKNKVTEQAITDFYTQNKSLFLAPEQVSLDYIRLSMQDIKQSIQLTDAQIKQYYDENRSTITKPFADVQDEIRTQLIAELAQAKYAQTLETLSDLSYQTPDTLLPVAESLSIPVETSPLVSRSDTDHGWLNNKKIIEAAFSHDVLDLGNNSEPVQLDNDTVVVLRVNQHVVAAEKPLNEVRSLIVDELAKKHAKDEAARVGEKLLDGSTDSLETHHLEWLAIKMATRDSDTVPAAVNELAFNIPHVNEKKGMSLPNGDYVLVALNAIHDGDVATLDKEHLSSITQQIESNYGVMDYDLYVSGLMSQANIVKH